MILSFFYSDKYLRFLESILGIKVHQLSDFRFHYAMLSGQKGNVINALPFFGSFGGPLCDTKQDIVELNKSIDGLIDLYNPLTFLFIENPFSPIDKIFFPKFKECSSRIFQWTELGDDRLFERIASSARRNIKKAMRSGVSVDWKDSNYNDNMLWHVDNMRVKNVKAKPQKFYEELENHFVYGSNYRIYYAYLETYKIASLLLFYHDQTVEYFIPSYDPNYMKLEPMSLLIYEAMKDAIAMGFKYWSWGGICKDAISVYNYKRKWNSKELNYRYFIYNDIDRIQGISQENLSEYPYFYVYPFNKN